MNDLGFSLREYSVNDFPKIHSKLRPFWKKGKDRWYFDDKEFFVICGALTEKGAVVMDGNPTRFEKAQNLMRWYVPAAVVRRVWEEFKEQLPLVDEPF